MESVPNHKNKQERLGTVKRTTTQAHLCPPLLGELLTLYYLSNYWCSFLKIHGRVHSMRHFGNRLPIYIKLIYITITKGHMREVSVLEKPWLGCFIDCHVCSLCQVANSTQQSIHHQS